MEVHLIREIKELINKGDLNSLKELWINYQKIDFEIPIAWDYIFQKVYIHSCLKKQIIIVKWLESLFPLLNDIHKIAIRHTLIYGKYLLNK
jgi:hypothetical protein